MKRFTLAGLFALTFAAGVGASHLQFQIYRDNSTPEFYLQGNLCRPWEELRSIAPLQYGEGIYLFTACNVGTDTIVRMTKWNPIGGDQTAPIQPVLAPGPVGSPTIDCSMYEGFVPTTDNLSCVPPDHPLARK